MGCVADRFLDKDQQKACTFCGVSFHRDKRCTWAHWERVRFCSRECCSLNRTAEANENRPPVAEVFAKWIDKSGDCWLWTGGVDKDGYGAFSYAGKTRRAPVVALELDGRPPQPGQYACHSCDNPPCVRPSHLYPGTPTQNMADAVARDRVQRGERQHMAKLTVAAVQEIRGSSVSDSLLAAKFGVTHGAVNMARNRKTWKHVA
jgi:hypothetical protein